MYLETILLLGVAATTTATAAAAAVVVVAAAFQPIAVPFRISERWAPSLSLALGSPSAGLVSIVRTNHP